MGVPNIQLYIHLLIFLKISVNGQSSQLHDNKLPYVNQYGDAYGKEWIFFPDGDGVPHFVNLTLADIENVPYMRSSYIDVEYRLYTRNNIENYIILSDMGEPLGEVNNEVMLSNAPLKIITHGWKSSAEKSAVRNIKDAYLEVQDVNVITVDWSYTADSIFYHWVANETKIVGAQLGTFLNALNERYNVTGDKIHLIGHSLGAHIMGIAASNSNFTIDRITGLDPARPLFEYPSRNDSEKLDSSDANFVDIIHTCGGVLGIEEAIGTVDFYPNSGIPPQPGCDSIQKILEACSHSRSYYYFAESIKTPKAFPAFQCKNWTDYMSNRCDQYGYMGEGINRNIKGKLFLKTNPSQPFGRSFEMFCTLR